MGAVKIITTLVLFALAVFAVIALEGAFLAQAVPYTLRYIIGVSMFVGGVIGFAIANVWKGG